MTKTFIACAVALTTGTFIHAQAPAFSENFESGKLDAAVWDQRVSGTATVAVEPVDGAHGKNALHVHYPMAGRNSYGFIVATHVPDAVKGHLFGRAYMKIVGDIGGGHNPFLFAGNGAWPASNFYEIGSRGIPGPQPNWMPSLQENKAATAAQGRGETTYHSDSPVPIGKWFLLEWEFNDSPSSITIWIDGEKVVTTFNNEKIDTVKFEWPKASGTTSGIIAGFNELGFGARVFGAPPADFDVYYDDIAIGTSRLGPAK